MRSPGSPQASPCRAVHRLRLRPSPRVCKPASRRLAAVPAVEWLAVAKGVVDAIKELEIKIPVVVRLAGTKVEEGRRIIDGSGLTMISADSLAEAADKVVAAAKSSRAAA